MKPSGRDGSWRLGVVEEVLDGDRFKVRAYVAPAGAYEGTAAVYRADELVEVRRAQVEGYLQAVRAEAEQKLQLVRQIETALEAVDDETKK